MDHAPLAISCGDPSGIGPEVAARAWEQVGMRLPLLWVGDPAHLPSDVPQLTVETTDPEGLALAVGDARRQSALAVLPVPFAAPAQPGAPDPSNAAGVIAAIDQAVALAQSGAAAGVVTAPIHKKALKDGAGFAFPGHTEYLAALVDAPRPVMMLAAPALRVVPVTIHVSLAEVPQLLTQALLADTIRITDHALRRDFGIPQPRLAVAGLNPHAGEGGAMGREEIEVITPVLDTLRAEGFVLDGPRSADTMFHPEARSRYDCAVCMFHDQALIPIKTVDFAGGVNVTCGLPFVRTSPDHGTAYDIAGKGLADPTSMVAALDLAWQIAQTRGTV